MRDTQFLHQNWLFCKGNNVISSLTDLQRYQRIELPHNAVEVPLNYFDETELQQVFTYHYQLHCSEPELTKSQIVRFEGALSDTHVYVNGHLVAHHADGYTPFDANLTPALKPGNNLITVTLSGEENPAIPPFGGRIDYLCFPGIYRAVSLTRYDAVRIRNVKIETHDVLTEPVVDVAIYLQQLKSYHGFLSMEIQLISPDGNCIASQTVTKIADVSAPVSVPFSHLGEISLWDCQHPSLYQLRVVLHGENIDDDYQTRFGFRHTSFTANGFYLNGKRIQLIGINRHQSYPYIGYAMGKRGQELDAELIRQELGFNLVRTSHYPQSPDFLDRCDELGLLVFEEIAGWQHIGDKAWQQQSIDNVRSMIERDWNHPAIILWGVRINESPDNHDFYTQTNALAHELDMTRQTGGVRCIQQSEMLEDVYTMNDFILSDSKLNPDGVHALRAPQNNTGLRQPVPYLVTEYAGHMFPAKHTDCETWQNEHVMRHLKVLDASFANPNISGAIAWCLFDYHTHHDFGSGDKICYHGITDAFRLPKFAASVYASQCNPEDNVVLKPVTYWTRGERPEAKALPLIILTNCDQVDVEVAGHIRRFYPDRTRFAHLPHPPVIIDETNQGDLPVGDWGYDWNDLKIRGYLNDEVVMGTELSASPQLKTLDIQLQTTTLNANCGDSTRIVLRALDQKHQQLPYFRDVITLTTSDNLTVIGPCQLIMDGGIAGLWVKAAQAGPGWIKIQSQTFTEKRIDITITDLLSTPCDSCLEVQHG